MRTRHATSRQTSRFLAAAMLLVVGGFPGLAPASPELGALKRTDKLDVRRIGKATEAERAVLRIEWRAGLSDVDTDRSLAEMSVKLRDLESGVTVVRDALNSMPARQKPADPVAMAIPAESDGSFDWRLMAANLTALVLVAIWWFSRRKSQAEIAALEAQLNSRARAEPMTPPDVPMEKAVTPEPASPAPAAQTSDPFFDFDQLPPAEPEPPPEASSTNVPAAVQPKTDLPPEPNPDVATSLPVASPAPPPDIVDLPVPDQVAELASLPSLDPVDAAQPVTPAAADAPGEPAIEFNIDEPEPETPGVKDELPENVLEFNTEIAPLSDPSSAVAPPPGAVLEFSIDVDPAPSPADAPPPSPEAGAGSAGVPANAPEATLQMAEIMLSMGLEEGAAQALLDYSQANPKHAIHHMLKLLGIYRQRGLKQEFQNIAEKLRQNFNIQAAEWTVSDAGETPGLEKFSRVAEHVQSLWHQPAECIVYLHHLIEDNREGARAGFPQAVAEEILLLIDVLQESTPQGQAAG